MTSEIVTFGLRAVLREPTCPHTNARSWPQPHGQLPYTVMCDDCHTWWDAVVPRGKVITR